LTKSRHAALALTVSASLGLAACGSDEGAPATATTGSAGEARAQAAATRDALHAALRQLRAGDRQAAENTVEEGYLQHFEDVEGPLGKVDAALKEELEDTLRGELRQKIRSGAPVAEIAALMTSLDADLATAEEKLR
jgi:hypothetical protein